MSERALVAPVFAREARVHNRDRLLRVAVVDGEIAAFAKLETEGGEVAVGN
jgi:predicted secreted protein